MGSLLWNSDFVQLASRYTGQKVTLYSVIRVQTTRYHVNRDTVRVTTWKMRPFLLCLLASFWSQSDGCSRLSWLITICGVMELCNSERWRHSYSVHCCLCGRLAVSTGEPCRDTLLSPAAGMTVPLFLAQLDRKVVALTQCTGFCLQAKYTWQ